ncbi:MAG: SDR family NAD(P)-dependent oxidoreductase, partial [Solirubrobacterales bacterium]
MTQVLGATSTADEVLSGVDLTGKRFLITGVSSGIGLETARSLASHGAAIVGADVDRAQAEQATAPVREAASQGGGSLELVELDLASLQN